MNDGSCSGAGAWCTSRWTTPRTPFETPSRRCSARGTERKTRPGSAPSPASSSGSAGCAGTSPRGDWPEALHGPRGRVRKSRQKGAANLRPRRRREWTRGKPARRMMGTRRGDRTMRQLTMTAESAGAGRGTAAESRGAPAPARRRSRCGGGTARALRFPRGGEDGTRCATSHASRALASVCESRGLRHGRVRS